MEQRSIGTLVLVSITSGRLMCDHFGQMQDAVEFIVGHPVWTHEFADKAFNERVKGIVLAQHPDLATADLEGVTPENVDEYRERVIAALGPVRMVTKGDAERKADPLTTATEVLSGKAASL